MRQRLFCFWLCFYVLVNLRSLLEICRWAYSLPASPWTPITDRWPSATTQTSEVRACLTHVLVMRSKERFCLCKTILERWERISPAGFGWGLCFVLNYHARNVLSLFPPAIFPNERVCKNILQWMAVYDVGEISVLNNLAAVRRWSVLTRRNLGEAHVDGKVLTTGEHSLIGDPARARSIFGGKLKRLAFTSELLTNPSLMFSDEPTSGLDSFMAFNVISVLRKEALTGKTIVCTIHQPSSQVFALFDQWVEHRHVRTRIHSRPRRIYLMAEHRVAFAGPTKDAMTFYESVGHPSPGNFNPADHYIRALSVVPNTYQGECVHRRGFCIRAGDLWFVRVEREWSWAASTLCYWENRILW